MTFSSTKSALRRRKILNGTAPSRVFCGHRIVILTLSNKLLTIKELARGDLEKVIVSGTTGDVVLMGAGQDAVLSGFTKQGANTGLVLVEMKRTSSKLGQLMKGS